MNNFTYTGGALTKRFESCALVAYHGAADKTGVWTIGYGHIQGVKEGDTCTQEQADAWLQVETESAADAVNMLVLIPITQDEFNALVDFVFNEGAHALATSTLLRMLNAGNISGAAHEFEQWDMAAGVHVAGLLRRRLAEESEFKGATP